LELAWSPTTPKQINANIPRTWIDVRMKDPSSEIYSWAFERIICGKMDAKKEDASAVS
jgi:hypothetical protein